jgi:hypothetical protein
LSKKAQIGYNIIAFIIPFQKPLYFGTAVFWRYYFKGYSNYVQNVCGLLFTKKGAVHPFLFFDFPRHSEGATEESHGRKGGVVAPFSRSGDSSRCSE